MKKQFDTLLQMMAAFPDEQAAVDHFTAIRWKEGEFCPHCGSTRVYHFSDLRNHKCGDCRKRFSIKVGTIFEDSKIPLRTWMMAIWMITLHKKGIASTQLAKDLGVTQKTAWFMTQRLRFAIRTKSFNRPLNGKIEIEETFIGGKEKNKHADKRAGGKQGGSGKIAVLSLLEREGELPTGITPNLAKRTIQHVIRENVEAGSTLMTEEHGAFNGLQGEFNHHRVNHSAAEYVRHFILHTNGIEGVWSLFKRQIVGTHHYLSPKHLSRYLGKMTWRFNRREMSEGNRVNALLEIARGRLTYKDLIA